MEQVQVPILYEADFYKLETGLYFLSSGCKLINSPLTPDEEKIALEGMQALTFIVGTDTTHFDIMGIKYVMRLNDDSRMWYKVTPLPLSLKQRIERIERHLNL